ncbi:ABC transporter permease [Micromonospora schwarzwaldensis]|uniref:ABC transporter permease n=1 Tax=Micromonospora sp. DSM 45708 TaxID=3111767 RepID=UPI0031E20A69
MKPPPRRFRARFWVELAAASLFGALFLVTLVRRDWLEAFGIEPDNHDGTVEWLLVAGLFVLSAACADSARLEWRRTAPAQ